MIYIFWCYVLMNIWENFYIVDIVSDPLDFVNKIHSYQWISLKYISEKILWTILETTEGTIIIPISKLP